MERRIELADLKSRFVADVSHELKTPLTVIRMFSELLRLGYAKRPEDVEKSLEVIARETDHLGLLIDNVLEASRIEAGEKEYHREPSDAAAEARRVVDEFRPYAEHKGFTVRFTEEGPLPPVELDRLAFTHALRNLLSNAVKYSGDVKEIDVRAGAAGGGVEVEVADRGVGIGGADPRRLFERFYRAPRERGRPIAGAGLGLALVKHIAEGLGGSVEARSREGGGSVFFLRFPPGNTPRGDA
jgi:signal transduction histidine kinase